jgi:ribosomal subunit interface protein
VQVRIIGSNIDIGTSLEKHVEEHLTKNVAKYFEKAIAGEVHFSKNGHLFKVVIVINEGVRGGIVVKSDAEAGDPYSCFAEALEKSTKQLRRYKRRIKNYRRYGGGIKSVAEPQIYDAMKYVIPPKYDALEEMDDDNFKEKDDKIDIISEKITDIEEISVEDAIMKMDLANLPALVFINKDNKKINVVYHRKDGNISWINPS